MYSNDLNTNPNLADTAPSSAPFESEYIQITKAEYIQIKSDASYWNKQHNLATLREKRLKKKNKELEAIIRDLRQRLYGKKTEKGSSKSEQEKKPSSNKRGQKKGSNGHGRTNRDNLPIREEEVDVPDKCCSVCGKERDVFPGTEDSEIIEIEVSAHKRKIKRKRYKKCSCEGSGIITAPIAPKILPKTNIGVSIWREIILNKVIRNQSTHQF